MPSKNFTYRSYGTPKQAESSQFHKHYNLKKITFPYANKYVPVRALLKWVEEQRKLLHLEEEMEALLLHRQQMGLQSPGYLLQLQVHG